MKSQILPISISNPFIPNPSIMPISSSSSQTQTVFINSNNYNNNNDVDLVNSSIESKPFLPRVSSDDRIIPSSSISSLFNQKRRRRAASEPNLSDLRSGGRRFFCQSSGQNDEERFFVTRVGSKMLAYIG